MASCNACRAFTGLYELMYKSITAKSIPPNLDSREAIPEFFKLHDTFAMLRSAAKQGCQFCSLIESNPSNNMRWKIMVENMTLADFEPLGPVFIGTSAWNLRTGQTFPRVQVSIPSMPASSDLMSICDLEVFAPREQFPPDINKLLQKEIISESMTAACLSIAKGWLQECETSHYQCQMSLQRDKPLPTRMIDVGSDAEHPSLFIPSTPIAAKWAALSYCWGGKSSFLLNNESYSKLTEGIPLVDFPATLRDAISITRALSIPYLWIDALCIFQDSEEDWLKEAPKMGSIYRDAEVVIAATLSPTSTSGIFHKRPFRGSCPMVWQNSSESDEEYRFQDTTVYVRPVARGLGADKRPLHKRGWTFQENMLATRVLSYRYDQMSWECLEFTESEDGHVRLLDRVHNDGSLNYTRQVLTRGPGNSFTEDVLQSIPKKELYDMWKSVVLSYSLRSLTVITDRLPAISSLAKAFNTFMIDEYCAGIWKDDLISSLLWSRTAPFSTVDGSQMVPFKTALTSLTHKKYIAPSWSWASLAIGKLEFETITADFKAFAQLQEISLQLRSADPFGQLNGGWIRLKAPFLRIESLAYHEQSDSSYPLFQKFVQRFFDPSKGIGRYEYQQQHVPSLAQHFAAIQVATFSMQDTAWEQDAPCFQILLLESTEAENVPAPYQGAVYRRIGRLNLRRSALASIDPDVRPGHLFVGEEEVLVWFEVSQNSWLHEDIIII